jgi:hypothetical protein
MKSRIPLLVAIAVILVLVIVPPIFLKETGPLPFDRAVWKATSAESKWTNESVRYRMREGAMAEVRKAKTPQEVEAILGPSPSNSIMPSSKVKGESVFAYRYLLGWNRKSGLFGEKTGETYLDVSLDMGTHTTEAKLTTLDSSVNP